MEQKLLEWKGPVYKCEKPVNDYRMAVDTVFPQKVYFFDMEGNFVNSGLWVQLQGAAMYEECIESFHEYLKNMAAQKPSKGVTDVDVPGMGGEQFALRLSHDWFNKKRDEMDQDIMKAAQAIVQLERNGEILQDLFINQIQDSMEELSKVEWNHVPINRSLVNPMDLLYTLDDNQVIDAYYLAMADGKGRKITWHPFHMSSEMELPKFLYVITKKTFE